MFGVDGIAAGFFEEFASSTDNEGTCGFEARVAFFLLPSPSFSGLLRGSCFRFRATVWRVGFDGAAADGFAVGFFDELDSPTDLSLIHI